MDLFKSIDNSKYDKMKKEFIERLNGIWKWGFSLSGI